MTAKILIVDDSLFMRKQIRNILSKNGYEIAGEATDGTQAVHLYRELRPDIVIMDITMPGKNGIEALKAIKEYDYNAKVIMCTALGQQSKLKEAIKIGADDYIVKPFLAKRVLDSVYRVLEL
jgi:two-component system chemotaxis response regulator CheY